MEKDRKQLFLLAILERSLNKAIHVLATISLYVLALAPFPVLFLFSSCEKNTSTNSDVFTHFSLNTASSLESPESKNLDWKLIRRLDVFVFDYGEEGDLDFYDRLDHNPSGGFEVLSSGGEKRLAVLANCDFSDEEISDIWNFNDFKALEMSLRNDSPEYPMMSGDTLFHAGSSSKIEIEPMLSRLYVNINSPEVELENVSIYLTGVNSRGGVLSRAEFEPTDILNSGRLREDDLKSMKYPRMICNNLSDLKTGVLYCYPNSVDEESTGMIATRLVVEGQIDGETNYYPIKLKVDKRNYCYNIDVNISGKGTSDPEEDLRTFEGTASAQVLPAQYLEGTIGDTLHISVKTVPDWASVEFDDELLDDDRSRGLYEFKLGEDGKSIDLYIEGSGMGAMLAKVGPPVNDSYAIIVICKGKTQ